jgi:hypothetical protein
MKIVKYLPKFLRAMIATLVVMREQEYGGTFYDFLHAQANNGEMELLHKWENNEEMEAAWELLENAFTNGRDFVWVGAVKTGQSRGYMIIHSNKTTMWMRGFIPGIYEPLDAFRDAMLRARKDALALGYHPKEMK